MAEEREIVADAERRSRPGSKTHSAASGRRKAAIQTIAAQTMKMGPVFPNYNGEDFGRRREGTDALVAGRTSGSESPDSTSRERVLHWPVQDQGAPRKASRATAQRLTLNRIRAECLTDASGKLFFPDQTRNCSSQLHGTTALP